MITSKVTSKGQTTIPRKIRKALQIESGESLVYDFINNQVVIRRHPGINAAFGLLKPTHAVEVEKARVEARSEWVDEIVRENSEG